MLQSFYELYIMFQSFIKKQLKISILANFWETV